VSILEILARRSSRRLCSPLAVHNYIRDPDYRRRAIRRAATAIVIRMNLPGRTRIADSEGMEINNA